MMSWSGLHHSPVYMWYNPHKTEPERSVECPNGKILVLMTWSTNHKICGISRRVMAERQRVPWGASIRAILGKAGRDWGAKRASGGADDGKPKAVAMVSLEIISDRALYLSTLPSALYFTVKIHLHPTGFLPLGRSVISHVPFFSNARTSSSTAAFHLGYLKASWIFWGTCISVMLEVCLD